MSVSSICHVHVVHAVASRSASAPVVSSSGAFSAATASVVSQSASAAVVTSLGAASVVTQSASSSAVSSCSDAISFKVSGVLLPPPFRRVYSIP